MKTLDRDERQVLFRKYIISGLDSSEAKEKLNKFHNYLKDMQKRLSKAGKDNEEIQDKFKEEFYKLCQSLER